MTLTDNEILARARVIKKAQKVERKAKAPPKVRQPRTKPDRGRERNNAYLAWLRRQPCAARGLGSCDGAIEAAHVRYSGGGRTNPGMQRKPDDKYAVPLCASHHRMGPNAQHSMNEARFWGQVGIDVAEFMAALFEAFTTGKGEVMRKFNGDIVRRGER